MLLGWHYLKNCTWLLRVAETNPLLYLTFGYRFTQNWLVFCSIPCSFVCELIIYDVMFILLLLLVLVYGVPFVPKLYKNALFINYKHTL